jgi:2-iminoacetate synthase
VTDREYLQLLCALKIFAPELNLSISTRDSPALRDLLLTTIASSASAGSKTQPGGYAVAPESLAQFSIDDERSPAEIAAMLRRSGLQPVWQDWHNILGRSAV